MATKQDSKLTRFTRRAAVAAIPAIMAMGVACEPIEPVEPGGKTPGGTEKPGGGDEKPVGKVVGKFDTSNLEPFLLDRGRINTDKFREFLNSDVLDLTLDKYVDGTETGTLTDAIIEAIFNEPGSRFQTKAKEIKIHFKTQDNKPGELYDEPLADVFLMFAEVPKSGNFWTGKYDSPTDKGTTGYFYNPIYKKWPANIKLTVSVMEGSIIPLVAPYQITNHRSLNYNLYVTTRQEMDCFINKIKLCNSYNVKTDWEQSSAKVAIVPKKREDFVSYPLNPDNNNFETRTTAEYAQQVSNPYQIGNPAIWTGQNGTRTATMDTDFQTIPNIQMKTR